MAKPSVFIGDFEPLRAKVAPAAGCYARLKRECDSYLFMDVPQTHPAMSITFMGLYIINLALMHRLCGERAYLDAAVRWMRAVCGYTHWGNDKKMADIDLSASWVLFGLSLGFDWLHDQLKDADRELIAAKIERHAGIFHAYKKATEGQGWSTEYWQNHNWINMTGLAAAGYVLRAHGLGGQAYIDEARENFTEVFSRMADDGSNYEGVSYWRYGGMWLFVYAYLLRSEEGLDLFSTSGYLQNTFYYRLYQCAPDLSQQLNFGDTHDRHSGHPACVYYLVAREYRDGHAQKLGDLVVEEFLDDEARLSKVRPGILPEAGLEYIWYDPTIVPRDFDDLPLTRHFPDLGLVTIKDGWGRDSKVLTFKCGYPGGKKQWLQGWELFRSKHLDCMSLSHHHPDNLAYIMARGSVFFSCDDGYNRTILPMHHNVLLVDDKLTDAEGVSDVYLDSARRRLKVDPGYTPDTSYFGTLDGWFSEGGITFFRGETSRIYPQDLHMREVSRFVFTDNLKFVLFIDRFSSSDEHLYSTICNTDAPATKNPANPDAPDVHADPVCPANQDNPAAVSGECSYYYPDVGMNYHVLSDMAITPASSEHTVTSIMTPQEPDKMARTTMRNLCHHSAGKIRSQLFAELFHYDDCAAEISLSNDMVTVVTEDARYRFVRTGASISIFVSKGGVEGGIERRYECLCSEVAR